MSLLQFARSDVVTVAPGSTVATAAKQMANRNVGCVLIEQFGKPVGILTDRDIVTRVVCAESDPGEVLVEQVMTPNPVTLDEELGLFEALEFMKSEGVRRFPVVDVEGDIAAFFSVDDVIYLLGLELSAIAAIVDHGLE